MNLEEKYQRLIAYIKELDRVAVAFSSGVDSTFLLYAAKQAVGDNAIAITAISDLIPKREQDEATKFCRDNGIKQIVYNANPFEVEGFSGNPSNRCYICKKHLFSHMKALALGQDIKYVLEGSNLDDEGDYRPGMQAIAELEILSPLRIIGFTKQEIRELSSEFGLPTANKPSFACLASRIPYEETITENKLFMVEKAEELLYNEGFKQFRVRIHGDDLARIEVLPEDFNRFMDEDYRIRIYDILKIYGFNYVSLDLKGYRTGSMNEVLK
ncbi:ATP-dependent sacrificial sulfur transferase LarE [Pseudobutyrivibrio xylanivorans]|uniref:ATP-dependent sacrificial sulfur transferase LarE n=2 Tax=Pseudobutyrivibrio xylanivorans TaxID=185007 RepID=A0A5P6VW33_PSEXY|nr:ATP-dependent sacrificial sulfur transferase LarE [Pseudobutyrivibrio xylanivorans]QFJ56244.1 ATP-dependent sacrificial sulfur transferase LarE [Pseudobutyrivibrio xylanivorans]